MKKNIARQILEGIELEKAEVILASKGISDEIQGMIEKLSKIQNEDLISLKEGIVIAFGVEDAERYALKVDDTLERVIDDLKESKQAIDDETAILSGEETIDMDSDMGDDLELGDELDDMGSVDSMTGPGDEPLGRKRIESKISKGDTLKEMSLRKLQHVKGKLEGLMEGAEKPSDNHEKLHRKIVDEIVERQIKGGKGKQKKTELKSWKGRKRSMHKLHKKGKK